jgi:hypothetical protein
MENTKKAEAPATIKTDAVKVEQPTGKGKFHDTVIVKGSAKHPSYPGKEFKTHKVHLPYLTANGLIETTKAI